MKRLLELSSKRKKEIFIIASVSFLMLLLQFLPHSRSPDQQAERLKAKQKISGVSQAYTLTLPNNRWFKMPLQTSQGKSTDLLLLDNGRTSEVVVKVYQRDNQSVVSINNTSIENLTKKFSNLSLEKQEEKPAANGQVIKFAKYKGQLDFSLRPKTYWVAYIESAQQVIEVIGTSLPGREAEVSAVVHSITLTRPND